MNRQTRTIRARWLTWIRVMVHNGPFPKQQPSTLPLYAEGVMTRSALSLAAWSFLTIALAAQQKSTTDVLLTFEDFPTPVNHPLRSTQAFIDRTKPSETQTAFEQRIRATAKAGPNFAGHYTIVSWPCGSACVSMVVVNSESLQIITKPLETVSLPIPDREVVQLRYRVTSALLIVDAFLGEDDHASVSYGQHFYVLKEGRLQLMRTVVDQPFTERIRKMQARP